MSHYTVAVFTEKGGKTLEELLTPYDENMDVPRYVKFTKEQLIKNVRAGLQNYLVSDLYKEYSSDPAAYKEAHGHNPGHIEYLEVEFPKRLLWSDEELYKNEILYYEESEIGENGEVYSTYNPNSKWDWYVVGGRWDGMLKLKLSHSEKECNSALVKNIDFTDFCTRAVLLPDGQWHEPGEMGWWGMSSETKEEHDDWVSTYNSRFIETANPEWTITIVDCHI